MPLQAIGWKNYTQGSHTLTGETSISHTQARYTWATGCIEKTHPSQRQGWFDEQISYSGELENFRASTRLQWITQYSQLSMPSDMYHWAYVITSSRTSRHSIIRYNCQDRRQANLVYCRTSNGKLKICLTWRTLTRLFEGTSYDLNTGGNSSKADRCQIFVNIIVDAKCGCWIKSPAT